MSDRIVAGRAARRGDVARSLIRQLKSKGNTALESRRTRLFAWLLVFALSQFATVRSASGACDLFPIAVSADTLTDASPGDTLPDIFNGGAPGNFGWLTWSGSPAVPALVKSLTAPGDSATYVNPDDPNDHDVSVGDRVRGKPGVSNSKQVRDALDALKSVDITVPVWDEVSGSGANTRYRVAGFARMRLLSYKLPGKSRISARFLGHVHCGAINQPPVVDAGPDQSVWLTEPVALHGEVSDDGLPGGVDPAVAWSVVEGPGEVFLADPNATATSVGFAIAGAYVVRLTANDGELEGHDDVMITVNQPNRPPVPATAPLITAEDTATDFQLIAHDPDGDALSFQVVTGPAHGTLSGEPPVLRYTPLPDYFGSDRIVYEISDGELSSGAVELMIEVLPRNDPPTADTQTLSTLEDTAVEVRLSGADIEGAGLSFEIRTAPLHGTLTGVPPELTYLPDDNFFGSDSFLFRVMDGELHSADAAVVILVGEVNDPPVAFAQTFTLEEDVSTSITLAGEDVEGSTLAFRIVTPPEHGALSGAAPELMYVPDRDYHGADSFVFMVDDGELDSEPATVSLTITPVNDPPRAAELEIETDEDIPVMIELTGADVDGDALEYEVVDPPLNGRIEGVPPAVVYVPATNHFGSDVFSFRVHDGALHSEPAVVSLTVHPVNDVPVAEGGEATVAEDGLVGITLNAHDVDGDPLSFEILESPANGELSGEAPNLIYAPSEDFFGSDVLRFRALDAASASEAATVSIIVLPVNDAPVAFAKSIATDQDTSVAVTLTGADIDGDDLTFAIVQPPAHGSLTGAPPALTYHPTAGFHGWDEFTFRVEDGALHSDEAAVSIEVRRVNQPPTVTLTAPADGATFSAGESIVIQAHADDDGAIEHVAFFANEELLAEVEAPPYRFTWSGAPAGEHGITAAAVDDAGTGGVSAPVGIRVVAEETGDFLVDAGADRIVTAPEIVELDGLVTAVGEVPPGEPLVSWTLIEGEDSAVVNEPWLPETSVEFVEPGEYRLRFAATWDGGFRTDTVRVVALPQMPARMESARSHRGRDFRFTLLDNHPLASEPNYYASQLLIHTETDTDVIITYEPSGWTQRVRAHAGETTVVELNTGEFEDTLGVSDEVLRNAIHVRAHEPVSLWLLKLQNATSEGTLLLPTSMLGREYMVAAYANSPSINVPGSIVDGSQFAVVAAEDDTVVTIIPAETVGGRTAGQSYEVTLQRGDTYRLIDRENVSGDLTGTIITASRPVAVFGGHTCANVPAGVVACNHLIEQLPPVNTWGRQFVTLPFAGRSGGDTVRVMASADQTLVRINEETLVLARGEFVERILTEPARILTSRPAFVTQFAHGGDYDFTAGDPFMVVVPPVEQFGGSHQFSTPTSIWHNHQGEIREAFTNHVNLVFPVEGLAALRLDGLPVSPEHVISIGDADYLGARIPVDSGAHTVDADVPVGVTVYGWGDYDAYGFAGGVYSDAVGPATRLELSQTTDRAATGSMKFVRAYVADELGRPVADQAVEFVVTGANPIRQRIVSGALGRATLEYSGLNEGEDRITALLPGLEDSVINLWVISAANQPPLVDAGDNVSLFLPDALTLNPVVSEGGAPVDGAMSVHWRTRSGPSAAVFDDPHAATTTVHFTEPGRYELELSVDDSEFETVDTLVVTAVYPVSSQLEARWILNPYVWEDLDSGHALEPGSTIRLTVELEGVAGGERWVHEFLDHDDLIVSQSGDTWESNELPAGTHELRVRSTGPHGLAVETEPFVLHISAPPTIEWVTPLVNTTVGFDEAIAIQANATDPDGSVASVALYFGPWPVMESIGGTLDFHGVVPGWGTHELRLVATDNTGLTRESTGVQVAVIPPVVTVSLLEPTEGRVFRIGEPLPFHAIASVGGPAEMTQVVFEWWGQRPWDWFPSWWFGVSDSTVPFQTALEPSNFNYPTRPGTYRYRARGVATYDGVGYSDEVTVEMLPAIGVSIAAPEDGAALVAGSTHEISLELDDPTAAFNRAEILINGSVFPVEDPSLDWVPDSTGTFAISARVYDHSGNFYDSTNTVTVEVIAPPVPQISLQPLISDLQGRVRVGKPVVVEVTAGIASPSTIDRIDLAMDGEIILVMTNEPYVRGFVPETPGTHVVTATAHGSHGTSATSEEWVFEATTWMNIAWESPRVEEWLPLGETRRLSVRPEDPGAILDRLEFRADGVTVATTDFTHADWTPVEAGDYTLQAVAVDRFGTEWPSPELVVRVAELEKPEVRFVSPTPDQRIPAGEPVSIDIVATDPDGVITNLVFRRFSAVTARTDSDRLITSLDLPPGRHHLTAETRDNTGLSHSKEIRVFVDRVLDSSLESPHSLTGETLSSSAIELRWELPAGTVYDSVVLERRDGVAAPWRERARLPGTQVDFQDHFLKSESRYEYRVHGVVESGEKSTDSEPATVRTPRYRQGMALVDLVEFYAATADESSAPEPMGMLSALGGTSPTVASSEFESGVNPLPRMVPIGLSDLNEVLLYPFSPAVGTEMILWRAGRDHRRSPAHEFVPGGFSRHGELLGSKNFDMIDSDLNVYGQRRAGWFIPPDRFFDLTPVVGELRIPSDHPPATDVYTTLNRAVDSNASRMRVGQAAWSYFSGPEADSPRLLPPVHHATLWIDLDEEDRSQRAVPYGGLDGLNSESTFHAINEIGQIVGQSRVFDADRPGVPATRAVRAQASAEYYPGIGLTDMGTFGGQFSAALDINDHGVAVGYSTLAPGETPEQSRPAYWLSDDTTPRHLPIPYPYRYGGANAINNDGTIVGWVADTEGNRGAVAWYWHGNPAATIDAEPFFNVVKLTDTVTDRFWVLETAGFVNEAGAIVGMGLRLSADNPNEAPEERPYLLLPGVSLGVDYNRDGLISLDDRDDLPGSVRYQFWVNDDADAGDLAVDDLPGTGSPNHGDEQVNGTTDFIDWFPVHLNIKRLLHVFPGNEFDYRLSHAGGGLNVVFTELVPEQAGDYLTTAMPTGFGPDADQPAASAQVRAVTPDGIVVPHWLLENIAWREGGVILVEATAPTFRPLELNIHSRDEPGRPLVTVRLPLRVSSVEDMYGFADMRGCGWDTACPVNVGFPNRPAFADVDRVFVFAHGYNVGHYEARAWAAEMFKRLWWAGDDQLFLAVNWNGAQTKLAGFTPNYHINVRNAFAAAGHLAGLLTQLKGEISVAGHSLGNMLVGSAIQDHAAPVTRYFMLNSAVPLEAYHTGFTNHPAMVHPGWAAYPERLYASEWHQLFPPNDGRNGLTWRGRFEDVESRTKLYNFYSSGEEVLETHSANDTPSITDILNVEFSKTPVFVGTHAWALQEKLKGRITADDWFWLSANPVISLYDTLLFSPRVGGLDPARKEIFGSRHGGWGFDPSWDWDSVGVTLQDGTQLTWASGRMPPQLTDSIDDATLRARPFFLHFEATRILEEPLDYGSALARVPEVRALLLAECIPARTLPVGANPLQIGRDFPIGEGGFDMNSRFQSSWPAARVGHDRTLSRWLHSDIKDVAYIFNHELFELLVSESNRVP